MKIVTSIALFMAGLGAIFYSYYGAIRELADEVGAMARSGDEMSALSRVFDIINTGEVPQITGFFYFGLLLMVVALVNLMGKRRTNDE